jgi:hypothetical protein
VALSAKFTGDSKILAKLQTRINRMRTKAEDTFVKPIEPVVREIRANVVKDSINEGGYSHVVTGNLLKNTRQEHNISITPDQIRVDIKFGYFVEYGLNLETGTGGAQVPLGPLQRWLKEKFNATPDKLYARSLALQKVIRSGSRAYPIIQPVWEVSKDDYVQRVEEKVNQLWR